MFIIGNTKHSLDADFLNLCVRILPQNVHNRWLLRNGRWLCSSIFIQKIYAVSSPSSSLICSIHRFGHQRPESKVRSDIPRAMGVWSGLNFGFAYDLPVNKATGTLIITPTFPILIGLNNIADSTDWKANSLSLGYPWLIHQGGAYSRDN